MRFLDYLNEQVKYVAIKNLPDWVKKILKSKGIKSDVEVIIGSDVSIGGNWHDYNVMDIYLYNAGRIEPQKAIGGMGPNDTQRERQVKQGFKTKLSQDKMILITNTYPKNATLYVSPDAMAKQLDDGQKQEITSEEYLVLVITRSLKASYMGENQREKEARRYNIDFRTIVNQLISKGLLNKNGAINTNGKNALLDKFDRHLDAYQAANKLGLKSNK